MFLDERSEGEKREERRGKEEEGRGRGKREEGTGHREEGRGKRGEVRRNKEMEEARWQKAQRRCVETSGDWF